MIDAMEIKVPTGRLVDGCYDSLGIILSDLMGK